MHENFSERARALVGTRFRPQGRGVGGLDCIGVAIAAFGVPDAGVRRNYRMRGDHEAEVMGFLPAYFRRVKEERLRPGDLLLMRVAEDQLHLGVRTEGGFVHADARLRQVVETPGMPPWPVIAIYRPRRK